MERRILAVEELVFSSHHRYTPKQTQRKENILLLRDIF
jgi:hypothetical protein